MIKTLTTMGISYLLFNEKGQKIGKDLLKGINKMGNSIINDVMKEIKKDGIKENGYTDSVDTDNKHTELST